MKRISLFCVGKLRQPALVELENTYRQRLQSFRFNVKELKDSGPKKEADNFQLELQKYKNPAVFLLREGGKLYNSREFSELLGELLTASRPPIFIMGGDQGLDMTLEEQFGPGISLSPLTFPHQLARVIFVEQLYRAESLRLGHPYHK